MARFMYPLPHDPAFSTFGLDDRFDGSRWLMTWNDHEQLYTVTLGHGHPEQGPWVSVTTVHKTVERHIGDDLSRGPTGYQDAWFDATIVLGEQAFPNDKRAAAAVVHAADDRSRVDPASCPDDLGPEWTSVTVSVDGIEHPAARRVAGDAWACLVDLPTVAIAVNGASVPARSELALSDQIRHLDRYR